MIVSLRHGLLLHCFPCCYRIRVRIMSELRGVDPPPNFCQCVKKKKTCDDNEVINAPFNSQQILKLDLLKIHNRHTETHETSSKMCKMFIEKDWRIQLQNSFYIFTLLLKEKIKILHLLIITIYTHSYPRFLDFGQRERISCICSSS